MFVEITLFQIYILHMMQHWLIDKVNSFWKYIFAVAANILVTRMRLYRCNYLLYEFSIGIQCLANGKYFVSHEYGILITYLRNEIKK